MVKKSKASSAESTAGGSFPADFSSTIKESAQQIWLAGLGAFAKAQEEGSKVFDTLVKEGVSIQRKTQSSAGEKLSEATSKMTSMAGDLSSRASGQWDKLETIFEGRVSKALGALGVPAASDIHTLNARIDELQRKLSRLEPKTTAARRAPEQTAGKTAAKRKAVRKAP